MRIGVAMRFVYKPDAGCLARRLPTAPLFAFAKL